MDDKQKVDLITELKHVGHHTVDEELWRIEHYLTQRQKGAEGLVRALEEMKTILMTFTYGDGTEKIPKEHMLKTLIEIAQQALDEWKKNRGDI